MYKFLYQCAATDAYHITYENFSLVTKSTVGNSHGGSWLAMRYLNIGMDLISRANMESKTIFCYLPIFASVP